MSRLTNEKLCELFASRRAVLPIGATEYTYQPHTGRNSNGTMFFEGNRLYSYGHHFCIAELNPERGTVDVTLRRFSMTTSHHVSRAVSALLRAGWKVVRVSTLDVRG